MGQTKFYWHSNSLRNIITVKYKSFDNSNLKDLSFDNECIPFWWTTKSKIWYKEIIEWLKYIIDYICIQLQLSGVIYTFFLSRYAKKVETVQCSAQS